MNQYVTGAVIKELRKKRNLTQNELAQILNVSDKTISKWETGRGYPDITLLEDIAGALGISTVELLSGNSITNRNRASNMRRSLMYVCPVCGNVIHSTGEAVISCCGIILPPLEAEQPDGEHMINVERVEDEFFVTVNHSMTKEHYISFLAYVSDGVFNMFKLYPEANAETRFKIKGSGIIYCYCNRHGLYKIKV